MSSNEVFLVSLYHKDPYKDWLLDLGNRNDYRLVGTSGTTTWIRDQGIECEALEEVVGLSPRLEGKVKSLTPDLYTGIMAEKPNELPDRIPYVGGVAVDLTPYQKDETFRPGKVDIGGPSLLRAAAKSWRTVTVISSPEAARYHRRNFPGSEEVRRRLATMAIERTLRYDLELLPELDDDPNQFDMETELGIRHTTSLRYGENPDQKARLGDNLFCAGTRPFRRINDGELSYTNCLDLEAARRLVVRNERLQVSVVKHTNPTGWARGDQPETVIREAWEGDPKSAYGSVVGINEKVTVPMLEVLDEYFVEGIIAPEFPEASVNWLQNRPKPRALRWNRDWNGRCEETVRSVCGNYLLQNNPTELESPQNWRIAGNTRVTDRQTNALREMWRICRWVNSNAAVLGGLNQVFGVGAGQQSRVDAVELSVKKYRDFHEGKGDPLVLASDGFFPFPDNVEIAAEIGVDAIVSPGGSKRDDEVLKAANDHDIGMVFTGTRAFYH